MRKQFLNDPDDVQWIRETALKCVALPEEWSGFKSFVLYGNEDGPEKLELYKSVDPFYNDEFFTVNLIEWD